MGKVGADLISSGTESAARAAQRSLEGVFSNKINILLSSMTGLRVYVEAVPLPGSLDPEDRSPGRLGMGASQARRLGGHGPKPTGRWSACRTVRRRSRDRIDRAQQDVEMPLRGLEPRLRD